MMPLHARTSSTVVSNACCTSTSTPSIASSLAPATTASVIAWVPPEREWNTTSSRRLSAIAAGQCSSTKLDEVEGEVLANVADVIDDDVPAVEPPLSPSRQEGVAVAAADDRLERERARLLEHHERRSGRSRRPA